MQQTWSVIEPQPGETLEIVAVKTDEIQFVQLNDKIRRLKLTFSNGAVLYVPVPDSMSDAEEVSKETSATYTSA